MGWLVFGLVGFFGWIVFGLVVLLWGGGWHFFGCVFFFVGWFVGLFWLAGWSWLVVFVGCFVFHLVVRFWWVGWLAFLVAGFFLVSWLVGCRWLFGWLAFSVGGFFGWLDVRFFFRLVAFLVGWMLFGLVAFWLDCFSFLFLVGCHFCWLVWIFGCLRLAFFGWLVGHGWLAVVWLDCFLGWLPFFDGLAAESAEGPWPGFTVLKHSSCPLPVPCWVRNFEAVEVGAKLQKIRAPTPGCREPCLKAQRS